MMNNVELVKSLYDAFKRGDLETIFAASDPNIKWISNADPALIPWGGERNGVEAAKGFFKELGDHVEFESFMPQEFFSGSDSVTVLGHTTARMKPSGGLVEHEWAHIFKIENGKVVEFRDFTDTHAVVQAYFGGDIHSVTVAASEQTARLHH
ncbi:ketosteroid isomerase-like protein [Rhodoblastus acidophilus]|uniref:nuclear transport factor 2 family protein n=1 Tax=Rhodoblastus acidophilus TaxID=1074 RepID=UPI002223FA83|nr:nuclear transport factor 2 family protein [Rhodoblastus acidophilus]MCW2286140.1 ketosteroid isomerase-like protein [Rhodoblastus acidophilus]MCW2335034.1 ketosteroid isomerase-like protein [Rhodoblastus acidophilus]